MRADRALTDRERARVRITHAIRTTMRRLALVPCALMNPRLLQVQIALCGPGIPRMRALGEGIAIAWPIVQRFRVEVGAVRPDERMHL